MKDTHGLEVSEFDIVADCAAKEALDEAGGVCHITSLRDKIESVANFSHYQNQLKDYIHELVIKKY